MKYVYNRVIAYVIDMLLVVLISVLLSRISFINPDINKYNKYNKLYSEFNLNYQSYVNDLSKYYGNSEISDKEYNKLVEKYGDIASSLVKYYDDSVIDKKEYDKVINETNKSYMKENKKLYFDLSKYSFIYNIILFVVIILYFIVLNIFTRGQTIGKKLLGLKIVNVNDGEVSIFNYIIRCIILYGPLYYLIEIVGVRLLNINDFYTLSLIISNLKNYVLVATFMFILFRKDNRGLHDIICRTKVISVAAKREEDVEVIKETSKKKSSKDKKIVIDEKEK
ncbi:MAG: RDD family protein [Bacilli bacterium]|nr:RDD family protein [Bacilli bacterium]